MVLISKEGPPLCCTVLFINRALLGRNVSMSCHRMFNLVMIFVAVLVWLTEHSVVLWIYISNPSIFVFKKLKFYVFQIMWDFRLYVTCNGNFFKRVTSPWSSKKEKTNHDLFLTILLLLLKLKLLVLIQVIVIVLFHYSPLCEVFLNLYYVRSFLALSNTKTHPK